MFDHIIERRRCTGHLQSYIETANAELEHGILYRLPFGAIDRKGCSHFLGYFQTKRINVSYHNILRTRITTNACCHRADEACAGNEDIFAEQREGQSGVCRVTKGIHDRRKVIGDLRMHFHHI